MAARVCRQNNWLLLDVFAGERTVVRAVNVVVTVACGLKTSINTCVFSRHQCSPKILLPARYDIIIAFVVVGNVGYSNVEVYFKARSK